MSTARDSPGGELQSLILVWEALEAVLAQLHLGILHRNALGHDPRKTRLEEHRSRARHRLTLRRLVAA
jgi:hypothetical protein